MSKLCALVIGHKKKSPGAENANKNITEFDFNEDLAMRIEKTIEKSQIQRIYRRTYKQLPADINELNPDFIISLHCNAFDTNASGTEVLYYHKSERGKKVADILLSHLVDHLNSFGITEIIINLHYKPTQFYKYFGTRLLYFYVPKLLGEMRTVVALRSWLGKSFILML